MATYNKFQGFVGYLGLGAMNCNTDTFNCYMTNATPSASADDVKTDLAEISTGNGYTGPLDVTNTFSEAAGTGTMGATDVSWTASGGAIAQFQYAVIYNDTHGSDILQNWWDYGSAVDLADGESFTVDFAAGGLWTLA